MIKCQTKDTMGAGWDGIGLWVPHEFSIVG